MVLDMISEIIRESDEGANVFRLHRKRKVANFVSLVLGKRESGRIDYVSDILDLVHAKPALGRVKRYFEGAQTVKDLLKTYDEISTSVGACTITSSMYSSIMI